MSTMSVVYSHKIHRKTTILNKFKRIIDSCDNFNTFTLVLHFLNKKNSHISRFKLRNLEILAFPQITSFTTWL